MGMDEQVDVVIIGGGPAGLSAALCLGRARKEVVVIDAGAPRHAVAAGVHNLLTREGMPPAELRRVAWEQMAAYPSVRRASDRRVSGLTWEGAAWRVETEEGDVWRARAALLATGVVDIPPDLPGFRERWGHSIHQCPFCHGWESRDLPLAVLGSGEGAVHLGRLLKGWSDDVVVLTDGGPLDAEQAEALARAGVPVYTQRVTGLIGPGRELEAVRFADGVALPRRALFAAMPQRQTPLVAGLGLDVDEAGYVRVDMQMRTSIPMLWAAGDVTSRMQQVVESAAQGLRAGAMITAALTVV